jgi:glycosyltransferase involved in cell wall biosynthesis
VSDSAVLIVSLGSTIGLREADEQLRAALERAGAEVRLVRARAPRRVRTLMLTDLAWARAARKESERALGAPAGTSASPGAPAGAPAVIYSSTTAALLWPAPGAIRFDATAAGNRPGRHGIWQRALERRRLGAAPLLLPWSSGALEEAPPEARAGASGRVLVLPVAVEPSGPAAGERDIAAIAYAANPAKKGIDRVLGAWQALGGEGRSGGGPAQGELLLAGIGARELERFLGRRPPEGVRALGTLPRDEYRSLLRRARVFVCAPRREDYGIAQLEALADGCMLVTTPAPGPYAALAIARELDARLVDEELARALAAALAQPRADYARRARLALAPFSPAAIQRVVSGELLARLLGERAQGR